VWYYKVYEEVSLSPRCHAREGDYTGDCATGSQNSPKRAHDTQKATAEQAQLLQQQERAERDAVQREETAVRHSAPYFAMVNCYIVTVFDRKIRPKIQ
jgi:hypothetical protein